MKIAVFSLAYPVDFSGLGKQIRRSRCVKFAYSVSFKLTDIRTDFNSLQKACYDRACVVT